MDGERRKVKRLTALMKTTRIGTKKVDEDLDCPEDDNEQEQTFGNPKTKT